MHPQCFLGGCPKVLKTIIYSTQKNTCHQKRVAELLFLCTVREQAIFLLRCFSVLFPLSCFFMVGWVGGDAWQQAKDGRDAARVKS